jgi:hypothetical protein
LQGRDRGGIRAIGAEGDDAADGKVNSDEGAGMNGDTEGDDAADGKVNGDEGAGMNGDTEGEGDPGGESRG